ncbi:uncharacterized protein LOC111704798 [Eurytemora carolleeae]|uniref:uncharacterized protein LOC111704798 n=1 Tax=Eurytemora carolleeae TaxID=1294199 RepID=UPI000C768F73|nr:uncharacterized protein LOC111704798 [Eurytemora carolleeae]|eukprot:XP_023332910.1 uncharacterized protein LOC111704798 [Eurytemora affinis]
MDWDDDAMVIEHNQKKFLFDYVADMLKEEGGKIFYRSNLTSDIDNMADKRLCAESLINCLIKQRAVNLVSVWLDFQDNFFVKEHLIERVSIGDKISSIGGTLGLFLGFSFLSVVDIVYWVIKTIEERIRRRKWK